MQWSNWKRNFGMEDKKQGIWGPKKARTFLDMDSDARKIAATCLVGGVVVAVGASLMHLYINGASLPLGLGFELGWPWRRSRKKKKLVRVYMDGCFDMMHYGHCNALRQARALGDQLVVGVVSDAEIIANKGPPVTPLHERFSSVI